MLYGEIFRVAISVIKKFIFYSCLDAFTACIIMTSAACTVHTLIDSIFIDCLTIIVTGILTSSVRMDNCTSKIWIAITGIFKRSDTKLSTHIIIHRKSIWHKSIAVKDFGNIEFSVLCLYFGDICYTLFQRCISPEIRFIKSSDFLASLSAFVIPFGLRWGLCIKLICSITLRTVLSLGM